MRYWTVGILLGLAATMADAQAPGSWTVSIRGSYSIPVGALGDMLRPGGGMVVGVGKRTTSEMSWEGVIDLARFSRPNSAALFHDSLSLQLEWAGGGVLGSYYFFGGEGMVNGVLHPYVMGGAVMTRWTYRRGAMAADTAGTLVVGAFTQQDWSLGVQAGAGCELYPTERVSLYFQGSYRLVIGEIWPTLALRFEGASGFEMFDAIVGVRVWL